MEKDLICKFIDYEVSGVVVILNWDGTEGAIKMTPRKTRDLSHVESVINDGGFGAQKILYAVIRVYKNYEYGATDFFYSEDINFVNPGEGVPDKYLDFMDEIC